MDCLLGRAKVNHLVLEVVPKSLFGRTPQVLLGGCITVEWHCAAHMPVDLYSRMVNLLPLYSWTVVHAGMGSPGMTYDAKPFGAESEPSHHGLDTWGSIRLFSILQSEE